MHVVDGQIYARDEQIAAKKKSMDELPPTVRKETMTKIYVLTKQIALAYAEQQMLANIVVKSQEKAQQKYTSLAYLHATTTNVLNLMGSMRKIWGKATTKEVEKFSIDHYKVSWKTWRTSTQNSRIQQVNYE